MVDNEGLSWNTDLVRSWFMEEEANLILSIPLSLFYPADSMIWTKESKGVFTTKSAYFVARTCHGLGGDEPVGSGINEETRFLWKALWRAKVPGKVKVCVWRGCMNALPTKVNLRHRRVLTEDLCGVCDKAAETVEHALLQCPQSAAIWFASPLGIRGFPRIEEGFDEWLINMAQSINKDSFELLLVLVWSVWKVRNEFVWQGKAASPLDVQLKAQSWLQEFKKWNEVSPQLPTVRDQKWKQPDLGWVKCNFDAAWHEEGAYGGIGVVVRNATGDFLAAMVLRQTGISSAMHAEAAAARSAAVFVQRWREDQVQLEGDALLVVAAIQNAGSAIQGHYGHLFDDTRRIMHECRNWKITFGPRETNRVAHRLARFSLTAAHPISWFEEPPDFISALLLEDSIHN